MRERVFDEKLVMRLGCLGENTNLPNYLISPIFEAQGVIGGLRRCMAPAAK